MKSQTWILIAIGVVAFYYFVLRKPTVVGMGAVTVPSGTNNTGYVGGGVPIAAGTYVQPVNGGNSTGSTLAGVGGLLGGIGSLGGSIIGALGNAGVFDSSSSGGSDDSSYSDSF